MAEIRSLAAIREKWVRVTPGRAEDYKIGVQNPRRDWEEETAQAEETYKLGVDAAHQKGLFVKGVRQAGSKKWQDRTLKKGPGRFSEGVYIAGPDYERGYAPYREAISRTDLGPKYPRRDPRNIDRVKKIVEAMVAEKVGA